jgi:hypothetical protein
MGVVTPAEALADIKESCRLIGSVTSEMSDEQYAVVKGEIERLEEFLNAIVKEAECRPSTEHRP